MKNGQHQHVLWSKCFHPSGCFSEFSKEELERSVPARFEKIVGQFPDRLAVKMESEILTYAELNAKANRVARTLIARLGREVSPVALLMENRTALVAATIGVLKAGKFFITLDPSMPKARVMTVLKDSDAALIVTDRGSLALARETASADCSILEMELIDCDTSAANLDLVISSKALATLVYTSGSTGDPKGVVWDHRDLLHRIMLRTSRPMPASRIVSSCYLPAPQTQSPTYFLLC